MRRRGTEDELTGLLETVALVAEDELAGLEDELTGLLETVALIAEDELAGLLETSHLLRSPPQRRAAAGGAGPRTPRGGV